MAEPSRRPLTTYARRRARAKFVNNAPSPQTSPLQHLPADKDITLSEMARRMKKRSRQTDAQDTTSMSPGFAIYEDHDLNEGNVRLAKKLKQRSESSSASQLPDDVRAGIRSSNGYILPLEGQAANEILFQTPLSLVPSDQSMKSSPAAVDQLSPVPLAKRVLSRTNSHNFKENRVISVTNGLASPFHSRPGSRTASPKDSEMKKKPGRPSFHMKSRTLSMNQKQNVTITAPVHQPKVSDLTPAAFLDVLDPHPAMDVILASKNKPNAATHIRTGSIPSMSSSHNDLSPDSWLVSAKVLTRSSPVMQPDLEVEHPSFFYGAPNQISTPPRKRRATTGTWALNQLRPQFDEELPVPPNRDGDVDMADASRPNTPPSPKPATPPPRRRRRTILHLPMNAQFSAVLDFSASQTLAESPHPVLEHAADLPNHSMSEDLPRPGRFTQGFDPQRLRSGLGRGLASAFSSARSSPATSSSVPVLSSTDVTQAVDSVTATDANMDGPLSPFRARPGPDLDQDELRDMFSVLGLVEDNKWASVAVPRNSPELSICLSRSRSYEMPVPKPTRTKEQTHRRKRGDTIRASDFVRPSDSDADRADAPRALHTRRTRSGTVTLSTSVSAGQAAVLPSAPPPTHKRRNGGLPITKMKTDNEPLCAAAGDSDDELLLRAGSCLN